MAKTSIAYESTFIVRPDTSDDAVKALRDKIKTIIKNHDGDLITTEDWGRRRLAYAIKGETRGYYTHLVFNGNNDLVAEIERNLRINEHVIRFLTVKLMDDYNAATFKRRPSTNIMSEQRTMIPVANAAPIPAATPTVTE